jgi:hypothetical protein
MRIQNKHCLLLVVCAFALTSCDRPREYVPTLPITSAPALKLSEPVDQLDELAREPMLVQHPDGTIFVAGYGANVPCLWRSGDGGATWTRVQVGTEAEGAIGNSDVDLAVSPSGTLYFVVMTFDRAKEEGIGIAVGASRDVGATWTWTQLSNDRYDDRPWVKVGPDGAAHAIWNDGSGVSYAVSRDDGATWQEQPRIHPQGGSSHLAIATTGEIAVRISPISASAHMQHEGVDRIAVSTDGGASWEKHAAPGERTWTFPYVENDPMPRWVEPLAWDASGALYYLWTNPAGLWLAQSTDRGATWMTWQIAQGGELRYFPYLTARRPGELAASWFTGRGVDLQVQVAKVDIVQRDSPLRLAQAPPFAPDSWERRQPPGEPRRRDTAGEYAAIAFLRDGRLAIVTPIQDDQAKRGGFSFRTIAAQ